MEIILLSIYAFIVWLIYFRFKLLPWTMPHKVTVVVLPVVALTALILSLRLSDAAISPAEAEHSSQVHWNPQRLCNAL